MEKHNWLTLDTKRHLSAEYNDVKENGKSNPHAERRAQFERRQNVPWVVDPNDRRSGYDRRTGLDRMGNSAVA